MDDKKRVTLSLDLGMPEERAFFEAYKSLPKSRAQEFLRRCVMIGFLSRNKPRHGFYEPSMETRLKSIHDSDMISKVSTIANDKPHQGTPHRPEAKRKEGFLAHLEDHVGPDEGYVFHDDFEEGSLPAATKARLSVAPESYPAQVAPVDARGTGWKRPKQPAQASVAPKVPTNPPETPASQAQGRTATAGKAAAHTSDAAHRLLEERIFQSLESKNEERSDEERASESGKAGGQTSGGGIAGSGDANLLKGFFGE